MNSLPLFRPEDEGIGTLLGTLANGLLFKLGGQYTFTFDELHTLRGEYLGLALAPDHGAQTITVTLVRRPDADACPR